MYYTPFTTELAETDQAAIVGNGGIVDVHTVARALNAPSGSRPRIYAYLERGESAGQSVKLASLYHLEQYETLIGFAWTSTIAIADLVRPA